MNIFGVNNIYMPAGCGFQAFPPTGLDFARFMQIPRYSVFDTNIFGYTPPVGFCAIPPFGYTTPNPFVQTFDFMFKFFTNPFYRPDIFRFTPQINRPNYDFFGKYTRFTIPSSPALTSPSISSSTNLLGLISNSSARKSESHSENTSTSSTKKDQSITANQNTTKKRSQSSTSGKYTKTSPTVAKAISLAESQVGVKEVRENDSERIRRYKNGAVNSNPWCCSFVSWLFGAGQNSTNSKTFGYSTSSLEVRNKSKAAGHYASKNSGYTPKAGDLIIFDHTKNGDNSAGGHIGIITKVNSDGSFETIEGNYSNSVSRVHRSRSSAALDGFVKMDEWLNA